VDCFIKPSRKDIKVGSSRQQPFLDPPRSPDRRGCKALGGLLTGCIHPCTGLGQPRIAKQLRRNSYAAASSVLAHCIYNCNAIQFGQTRCPTSLNFQPWSRSGLGRGQSLGGMASYRAVNRQAAREPVKASEPPGIPSGSFASRRVCLVMSRPTLSDRTASRRVCVTYKAPALTASH
jgi:hypothetical protein